MLPACLHSGVLRYTAPDRMFPPNMDLTDGRQESARDRWVQQQMEESMRHLPASPLLLEQMEREGVQRRSPPASLAGEEESPMSAAVTSGAVVSRPADVRAAASNPASSSATALSPRLAAALPMPSSSLAPARYSEATPDELEVRLRFFARQIKSFRRTSLLYSSPELRERIRQMEEDYGTAIKQFYCRPAPSSPSPQSAAAARPTSGPQSAAIVQPKGPGDASAQVIGGPGDASAQVIGGLADASAPAHDTEGLADASAPDHATEGLDDASAPALGLKAFQGIS
ncbi:hypothetical protein CRENBAI_007214 [Crenichthys baileyi]|uniref:Uncharacterized protein n=1 Tax=Crenichthys baileyi TaxID=28760 RepID=A0AAV9RKG6_9TELE